MDVIEPPIGLPQNFYVYPGRSWVPSRCGRAETLIKGVWVPYAEPSRNLVLYDWSTIASKLITGANEYRINAMYIEFRNMASPSDVADAPTYDRSNGIDYYNNLVESSDTDYLRVQLTASTLSSSDTSKFPLGNVATFFAQTAGTTGVHGKTFSDTVNSKVFGAALVSCPDFEDATLDLVCSRFYFTGIKQQGKLSTSQIGVTWPLRFN